jgi:tripartite-type tricarboxylate transporter receptor subunit TctC
MGKVQGKNRAWPGLLGVVASGVLGATLACAQPAQPYPVKPVRIIVPFAPGGPVDIIGRLLAPRLAEQLGQPVVVDNRGGAGGTLGMDACAKAPPDGYTMAIGSQSSLVFAPFLYASLAYDPVRDLAPVAGVAVTPYVLAVNARVPAQNVGELVRLARSKKDLMSYGSSGSGAISHISAELFSIATGASIVHVPYKGTAPALAAMVGGEIDMMFADLIPVQPHAQSGRLRLLAAAGAKRTLAAPQLPTIAESGIKMQPVEGLYGMVVPAGTPREIIVRVNTAILTALKAPEVRQRFEQLGYEIVGDSPEQYGATLKREVGVFGPVIRRAGIKPDA